MSGRMSETDPSGEPWIERGAEGPAIEGLAAAVIARLAGAGRPGDAEARPQLLRRLVGMVLAPGECDPDSVLADLRRYRVPDHVIVATYVPQAARLLGEMWVEDGLAFAEVSVGSARLQALVRRVEDGHGRPSGSHSGGATPLRLMIVVPADEQHTLGAVTLSVLRRRAGDEVALRLNPDPDELCRDLGRMSHDALILSCSTDRGLEVAAALFSRVRSNLPRPPVLSVGGPAVARLSPRSVPGADIATDEFAVVEKLARARRAGRIAEVE